MCQCRMATPHDPMRGRHVCQGCKKVSERCNSLHSLHITQMCIHSAMSCVPAQCQSKGSLQYEARTAHRQADQYTTTHSLFRTTTATAAWLDFHIKTCCTCSLLYSCTVKKAALHMPQLTCTCMMHPLFSSPHFCYTCIRSPEVPPAVCSGAVSPAEPAPATLPPPTPAPPAAGAAVAALRLLAPALPHVTLQTRCAAAQRRSAPLARPPESSFSNPNAFLF